MYYSTILEKEKKRNKKKKRREEINRKYITGSDVRVVSLDILGHVFNKSSSSTRTKTGPHKMKRGVEEISPRSRTRISTSYLSV